MQWNFGARSSIISNVFTVFTLTSGQNLLKAILAAPTALLPLLERAPSPFPPESMLRHASYALQHTVGSTQQNFAGDCWKFTISSNAPN